MSESIDFEKVHMAYFDKLRELEPDKDYCLMCFDDRNVIKERKLCVDCIYMQDMLKDIKKMEKNIN